MDAVSAFSAIYDKHVGDLQIVVRPQTEADAEFTVISQVLRVRSEVFDRMLAHNMAEASKHKVIIQGFSCKAVDAFLRYLYTDQLQVSAVTAVEVAALADKYDVQPLVHAASEVISKTLNVENACEVLQQSANRGIPSAFREALTLVVCFARKTLPNAFVLDANLLSRVLSNPQLCITDLDLAKILLAWPGNTLAERHDVDALLGRHVQLTAVNSYDYLKLEATARDAGLQPRLEQLRSQAKPGAETENVFATLDDMCYQQPPPQTLLGYWVVCIPSRADMLSSEAHLRAAAGRYPLRLQAFDEVTWFLPHYTLFLSGISFQGINDISQARGTPLLSVSANGVAWTAIFDAEYRRVLPDGEQAAVKVSPCRFMEGAKWFRLRVRSAGFNSCPHFHGMLVTG